MQISSVTEPVVSACICHRRSFRELRKLAERGGWRTVEQITAETGCGSGCGLCLPYLKRMLETGETELPILEPEEDSSR
jgi:bacterioferritin-associated ferredoxin